MSSGAEKSAKPCERFTAPCFSASRVISRMTDSVNELAFCETCRCFEIEGLAMAAHIIGHRPRQTLRDDLLAGGFAFQLFEDGTNRGCVAAVRRELEIFFVSRHRFLRLVALLIR